MATIRSIKRKLVDVIRSPHLKIAGGILVGFLITILIIFPFTVKGISMKPTLHSGDVIISTRAYLTNVERGDIVVICNKYNDDMLIVKRIIGIPGDLIEVKDNVLYINGELINESYCADDSAMKDFSINLEDNQYFAMGDNRSHSRDSRYYGPFGEEDIKAVGILIHLPFGK